MIFGELQVALGKRQKARGKVLTIEQSMNLHFYLNLIASNPYLVKLSVSQQQTLFNLNSPKIRIKRRLKVILIKKPLSPKERRVKNKIKLI